MTMNLKLVLAVFCAGVLTAPLVMAQAATSAPAAAEPTKEFVAETPNVPQLNRPTVTPRVGNCFPGTPCPVPEPGTLPLLAAAVLAAIAVARRKK